MNLELQKRCDDVTTELIQVVNKLSDKRKRFLVWKETLTIARTQFMHNARTQKAQEKN